MTDTETIKCRFWLALSLSLSLHLLLGWLLLQGIVLVRPLAEAQVIALELGTVPVSAAAARQQEAPHRSKPVQVGREKSVKTDATAATQLQEPALNPQASRPVLTTTSQEPPHTSAPPAAGSHVHQNTVSPTMQTAGTPVPVSVRQAEKAVPAKEPGRTAAPGSEYFLLIRARLERNKEYPPLARRGRKEGTVTVQFLIQNDGAVASARVVKSSGVNLLDQSALRTVHLSAPFPIPPASLDSRETSVSVPIVFKMDE